MADSSSTTTEVKKDVKEDRFKKAREFHRVAHSKSANNQAQVKGQPGKAGGSLSPAQGRSHSATIIGKDKVNSRSSTPRADGSRGGTPKTSRSTTPKVVPKYRYSRDDLMKYRMSPLVKEKPSEVSDPTKKSDIDIILDEPIGLENLRTKKWEAEVWYKHPVSFDSRGNSPMTVGGGSRRKNMGGSDADNNRGKEVMEEEDSIVLGPQRKSFGYGCAVAQQPRGGAKGPRDDREMDRREMRRIGSGRISIGRDDRPYRDERDYRGQDKNNYDRGFYNQNREMNRRRGGDRGGEYDDRRWNYDRHHSHEEMPEWFTDAPSSKNETIELRGFHDEAPEPGKKKARNTEAGGRGRDGPNKINNQNNNAETLRAQDKNKAKAHMVTERKGEDESRGGTSGPAVVPSGAELPKEGQACGSGGIPAFSDSSAMPPGFDMYNALFDSSGLPSIFSGLISDGRPQDTSAATGRGPTSSRFQQWFQHRSTTPQSMHSESAQSSINEEFSYLNDLLNGSKSPATQSFSPSGHTEEDLTQRGHREGRGPIGAPGTRHGRDGAQQVPTAATHHVPKGDAHRPPMGAAPAEIPQQVPSSAAQQVPTTEFMTTMDMEASLRAMLTRNKPAAGQGANASMALPTGKAIMAADLEATLTSSSRQPGSAYNPKSFMPINTPAEQADSSAASQSAFKRLAKPQPTYREKGRPLIGTHGNVDPTRVADDGDAAQNNSGGMTTLAELEGGMDRPDKASHPAQQLQQPPQDMSAFQSFLNQLRRQDVQQGLHDLLLFGARTPQNPFLDKNYIQQRVEQQNNHHNSAAYGAALQQSTFLKNLMMKNAAMGNRLGSPINLSGVSPRALSPQQLQQHGSRTNSPIVFGSQPPRHLAAPAPIHPAALGQPISPRGLAPPLGLLGAANLLGQGLRSPVPPPRQPSPQDLRAHAHAIMQNAILKKQLQQEREKLLKRQLEASAAQASVDMAHVSSAAGIVRDPASMAGNASAQMNMHLTSTPSVAKSTIDPAFIPTSVIRKAANESHDKDKLHFNQAEDAVVPPKLNMNQSDGDSRDMSGIEAEGAKDASASLSAEAAAGAEQELSSALERLGLETAGNPQLDSALRTLMAQSSAAAASAAQPNPRPRVGAQLNQGQQQLHHLQQQLQQHQAAQLQHTLHMLYSAQQRGSQPSATPMAGRAIVKNNQNPAGFGSNLTPSQQAVLEAIAQEQHRQQQAMMFPPAGAPPPQPMMANAGPTAPRTNPFVLQKLLQAQQQKNLGVQASQALQLAALAAQQQAMARGMHPALATAAPPPRPMFSNLGAHGFGAVTSMPTGLPAGLPSGRPIQAGPPTGASVGGGEQGAQGADLTKFFGSDILKQQAGSMPPLPASQGQQVMTVDEIERHQQMVSN